MVLLLPLRQHFLVSFLLVGSWKDRISSNAFVASPYSVSSQCPSKSLFGVRGYSNNWQKDVSSRRLMSTTSLLMGLDAVTYARTEFVSAALFTNQVPREADTAVQLGAYDGRGVQFVRRTIRKFITSSVDASGELSVSAKRQLRQAAERRDNGVRMEFAEQRADDLTEVEDSSVDIVLSMQSAAKMEENGLDWKRSVQEAGRVLKPGGRFLFVEQSTFGEDSYLEYIQTLTSFPKDKDGNMIEDEEERFGVFEEVGSDEVDWVLTPHIAGVAVKSSDAGMTKSEKVKTEEEKEKEKYAELSISVFEKGRKRKKKKKKAQKEESTST